MLKLAGAAFVTRYRRSCRRSERVDAALRHLALPSLGQWRDIFKESLHFLARYRQGLESADAQVRGEAAHLLHTLGYLEGVVDVLIAALADKDEFVRRSAAGALGLLGGHAAKSLPALRQPRAKESESVQKELDDFIAGLEAAKPPDPGEDAAARKRITEIAAFKRARDKDPTGVKK